jgi:hypothetical protein
MPGMLATHRWTGPIRIVTCDGVTEAPYLVINDDGGPVIVAVDEAGIVGSFPDGDGSAYPVLPVLEDHATLGCLLHLVRERWNERKRQVLAIGGTTVPWYVTIHEGDGFEIEIYNALGDEHIFEARALGDALLAALEALGGDDD